MVSRREVDLLRDPGAVVEGAVRGRCSGTTTRHGGGVPAQSLDGRTIFYVKDGGGADTSRLWSVPAEGGEDARSFLRSSLTTL